MEQNYNSRYSEIYKSCKCQVLEDMPLFAQLFKFLCYGKHFYIFHNLPLLYRVLLLLKINYVVTA